MSTTPLTSDPQRPATLPDPAQNYNAAMTRYRRLQAFDGPYVNPECQTQLLTHGQRQANALILLHGITNCPKQFDQFAPLFHERGYNVLIPRMPRNGYRDQATKDVVHLTLDEQKAFCHEVVDIACGLGERVAIFGLSAGGTLATWMAGHRSDVQRAVIAAPLLGLMSFLPPALSLGGTGFAGGLLRTIPNVTTIFPEKMPHGYVGFQTRSIGRVLRLAGEILAESRVRPPLTRSILFVTSAIDKAVSNNVTRILARRWQAQGASVSVHEFAPEDRVYHDLIDPRQQEQHIDFVYPYLIEEITEGL